MEMLRSHRLVFGWKSLNSCTVSCQIPNKWVWNSRDSFFIKTSVNQRQAAKYKEREADKRYAYRARIGKEADNYTHIILMPFVPGGISLKMGLNSLQATKLELIKIRKIYLTFFFILASLLDHVRYDVTRPVDRTVFFLLSKLKT